MRSSRLAMAGCLLIVIGVAIYFIGILLSVLRIFVWPSGSVDAVVASVLWWSGAPTTIGLALVIVDVFVFLPSKRRYVRFHDIADAPPGRVAVALTAYQDEKSIALAVRDFLAHPLVSRLIVVDNNSFDKTAEQAVLAGAEVVIERNPGYGRCVYRCLTELAACT